MTSPTPPSRFTSWPAVLTLSAGTLLFACAAFIFASPRVVPPCACENQALGDPSQPSDASPAARAENRRRGKLLGLLLLQHHQRTGRFPQSLAEIRTFSNDLCPVTGHKCWRYAPHAQGFSLSCGFNGGLDTDYPSMTYTHTSRGGSWVEDN